MSFQDSDEMPEKYNTPAKYKYFEMINSLAKLYSISFTEAGKYTMLHYYKVIGVENLDVERQTAKSKTSSGQSDYKPLE